MKSRQWSLWILSAAALPAVLFPQAQPPSNTGQSAAKTVYTGTTPKAINWPSPALPDGPIPLETGIERNLRLVVTKGFVQPWGMAFLPDGGILVTERPGRLRLVRNGTLEPEPIAGLPTIYSKGLGGLLDIALHPHFAENSLIYFTYQKPPAAGDTRANAPGTLTLGRGRWNGTAITGLEDLFTAAQANNGSRIIFGRDGMVYMRWRSGDPPPAEALRIPMILRANPPPPRRRHDSAR